jgi:UDP-2,4-diacetamido-2,4,6-trideoxy-beta-L-altropyranose hydrolase
LNILFRADSSFNIGLGHVMRDLVLAKQYKNDNIIFACQDLEGNINQKILDSGFNLKVLKNHEKDELLKLINDLKIDLLIIDHYGIDYEYEKYIKENSNIKILSFDDTYERHYCDILLNHNISANEKKYRELVPNFCELRCGSKYTLIRDEFVKEKRQKNRENNSKRKNIFIAMGGADSKNINIKILKILKKYKNIDINVITTTANKNLKQLQRYSFLNKNITLHVNTTKMAKLINQCDLAIVTPSVTVHEVLFLRKDFIAIKVTDNQDDMYKYLKRNRYKVCDDLHRLKGLLK